MKKLIYIKTSIPSFYFEVRAEPEMAARRNWTKQWWDSQRHHYQLVTSLAVIEELERGDYPNKEQVLGLLDDVPLLDIPGELIDIVDTYVSRKLMPADT